MKVMLAACTCREGRSVGKFHSLLQRLCNAEASQGKQEKTQAVRSVNVQPERLAPIQHQYALIRSVDV